MKDNMCIAVPSELPGGLEAKLDGHFGHCKAFTLATVKGGEISETRVVANGHDHGGCGAVPAMLKSEGVDAVIVGGIGGRPLELLRAQGIGVYVGQTGSVREVIERFVKQDLLIFDPSNACKGSGHCQGH